VLLYLCTFVVGVLIALILGTDLSGETQISTAHWVLSIIWSILLSSVFSLWYFRDKVIPWTAREGIYLGATFFVVGIVFDLLFLIPYIVAGVGNTEALVQYYLDIWFWVSVVLVVLMPVVVGGMGEKIHGKGKKKIGKSKKREKIKKKRNKNK
jgi:Na+-transporting methylmalonyl-CoA/oxaloacetate decarboxylase gamma subunit